MSASVDIVVLAAGVGSRLPGSASRPKWLTPVAGRTIAQAQLSGVEPHRPLVVTGHCAEQVGALGLETLHNAQYAELNNWWSLALALRERRARSRNGHLVVLNSDLWAPNAWFAQALGALLATDTAAMVIDTKRRLTDEAMKVSVAASGQVQAIGKVGVERPSGEYTGMLAVPAAALGPLEKALESFVGDPARRNAWYEHAIEVSLDLGMIWNAVEAPGDSWVEIDDRDDLDTAEALAAAS